MKRKHWIWKSRRQCRNRFVRGEHVLSILCKRRISGSHMCAKRDINVLGIPCAEKPGTKTTSTCITKYICILKMVSAQLSCNKFLTSWLLFSASAQAAGAHAFNFLNTTAPTSTKLSTTLSFATESETTSATTSTTTSEIAQAYKTDYPLPSGYVAKPPTSFTNNQVPPQQMNHGNPNPIILSLNESVDLAIMEANFYTYFAQNAPVPGTPRVQLPEVVCDTVSRLSRRKTSCETFKSFSFNVYFHYIWTPESTVNHLSRDLWEERIKLQVRYNISVVHCIGMRLH